MVLTRSPEKTTNMTISKEIRNYFSDLIKPLVTNQSLEEMFSKLKEEIMSKFEEKFEQQMNRIDKLEVKSEKQANRVLMSLKGKLLCRKIFQISWKSNVTTINNTANVPVFEFMESKYHRMDLLIV